MIKEASAMKVRQNLGELINEVQYRHDSVVVTRAGKPVAAIVDIALFNKMRLLEEEFDRAQKDLQDAFQGESPEAVDELLQKAKRASRRAKK
ncbi:MAG: type II toxin-antitoxin system Phd/YefM family antitoxin [Nitrospiria bacterium]